MTRACLVALATVAALAIAAMSRASPSQDYMLYCMGCHGADAQGVPGKIPPLAAALARYMRTDAGRNYVVRVPGAANSVLSDAQLAAVFNWLAATFPSPGDSPAAPFTPEEVTHTRHTPLANVQAARREVVRALAATGSAPAPEY